MPSFTRKKTKKWHDQHIRRKQFEVGQKVLLFNSRLKLFPGKLHSKWSRPFTVSKVHPHGAVEDTHDTKGTFIVNGKRLKSYMEGNISMAKTVTKLGNSE